MPLPPRIPFDEYRADVSTLSRQEVEIRSELVDWFPSTIIDAHVHNSLREHVLCMPERSLRHMASSFPWNSLLESRALDEMLFGKARVRRLRFSHAHPGVDHAAVNAWLETALKCTDDRFALFGLQTRIEATIQALRESNCVALKMYYLVTDPPGRTITDVFPDKILEECVVSRIPIILHLPRQITESIDDVCEVAARYPNLPIVLAHLGLPNYPRPGLREAYRRISALPNIFMDTACMEYGEIVITAIQELGPERVVFGSDEPISLLRVVPFLHPVKGPRVVPSKPMHWTDPTEFAEYGHLGKDAIMNHWQQMLALRAAFKAFGADEENIKHRVMHDNAAKLYRFD